MHETLQMRLQLVGRHAGRRDSMSVVDVQDRVSKCVYSVRRRKLVERVNTGRALYIEFMLRLDVRHVANIGIRVKNEIVIIAAQRD
jgi:hypothetical protein